MDLVELDGGMALSYCERGSATGPAVVLLPGPTDSWRSYESVLRAIPDDRRVVAVSLRGHGDSSKPVSGYRIEDLASDVLPMLDVLGIDRSVLVGHSGSCLVARRVALDEPDRVAGLFLEASPTTLRGDEQLARFVGSVVAELTEPIDREVARSFIEDTSKDAVTLELVELLTDELMKVPLVVWNELFESLLTYDDTVELPQLTMPVMLVWGDADQIVSRTAQDELLEVIPRSALAVYERAGHTPRWEQPERFARDLMTFSRRVLHL
jgi:non-heme chloroperoxidase